MLKKRKHYILVRLIFFVSLTFSFNNSYSQIYFRDKPNKYYETLIASLNPDSILIYEVNSDWGSGIAFFISYKKHKIESGYYFNNNLLYKILGGRNLLPPDSANNFFRVIIDKQKNIKKFISSVDKLKIFDLRYDYNLKDRCIKDFISDGSNFQLSKITKDTAFYKRYYEIYEYAKLCPHIKEYKRFVELDKLFQKTFNKSTSILQNIINEYRNRKNE